MTSPCLLPQPVIYEEERGHFSLDADLSIVVSHAAERGEWIAARTIQDALSRHNFGVPIQPQRRCLSTDATIVLAVRGRDDDVFPTLQPPAAGVLDGAEAYTLAVDERQVVLWGASPAGVAQAARTLCQLVAQAGDGLPALRIEDAPAFPWRGVMLDVSRGKVPTLATLKGIVDVIASFKLNKLMLYVEHTFAFRRHPDIGRGWGALTPEEIAELDAYCGDRYVELVPCLQSFGHLRHILELPPYRHLAESEALWSLTPAHEESYALLDDLYSDHLACFSSDYLNVCSDETFDLGMGQSREVAEREGRGHLFLKHIQRLHQLAEAHGRTMMVWDDMFLHYPELLGELPRDTILLNWWYDAMPTYRQVDVVKAAGLRQIVCPGTSTWNTLFPRQANARANIRAMALDGQRAGAMGVLVTDWGDHGHPNLLGMSWYGYAYSAAESWAPGRVDDAAFEACFARLFFDAEAEPALEAMRALDAACALPALRQGNGTRSLSMFFGDPLAVQPLNLTNEQLEFLVAMVRAHGEDASIESVRQEEKESGAPIPDEALARMHALAVEALDHLAGLAGATPEAEQTLDELRLAARQIAHAAAKATVGKQIVAAEADGGGSRAPAGAYDELLRLKRELHELRRAYERIWLARNKPEGMELTLDGFDAAARVLDRWTTQAAPFYGWQ